MCSLLESIIQRFGTTLDDINDFISNNSPTVLSYLNSCLLQINIPGGSTIRVTACGFTKNGAINECIQNTGLLNVNVASYMYIKYGFHLVHTNLCCLYVSPVNSTLQSMIWPLEMVSISTHETQQMPYQQFFMHPQIQQYPQAYVYSQQQPQQPQVHAYSVPFQQAQHPQPQQTFQQHENLHPTNVNFQQTQSQNNNFQTGFRENKPQPNKNFRANMPKRGRFSKPTFVTSRRFNQPYKKTSNGRDKFANKNPTTPCRFCVNSVHWTNLCYVFDTLEKRYNRAKELSLCIRCLEHGHTPLACTANKNNCFHCNEIDHHSAFCTKNEFFGAKPPGIIENPTVCTTQTQPGQTLPEKPHEAAIKNEQEPTSCFSPSTQLQNMQIGETSCA